MPSPKEEVLTEKAGDRRFAGSEGLWLSDSSWVSTQPWFEELFDELGRGGTSIRAIVDDWVQKLRELYATSGLLPRVVTRARNDPHVRSCRS